MIEADATATMPVDKRGDAEKLSSVYGQLSKQRDAP
jgi:hypothetical protein